MAEIQIAGAGPAGAAAAIAALTEGAAVHIFERSRTPRHKVCGEFISPEACRVLDSLGVWPDFMRQCPPRLTRCILRFGGRTKQWNLHEPAFGLSRLQLDRLILDRATALGARLSRGQSCNRTDQRPGEALILASGRRSGDSKGRRLFGFKTHFQGPADDSVALRFTKFGYVGISAVEDNLTNVCGLAAEDALRGYNFEIDEFLAGDAALAERLRPLSRTMPWLTTGPLTFSGVAQSTGSESVYPSGDALGFVDPFTGSGILNALLTGRLAGISAARQTTTHSYLRECARLLNGPFAVSALFRTVQQLGLSQLAVLVPGDWLYRLTRCMDYRKL